MWHDVLGNEVKVGDHIAYAVRSGDVASLKTGIIQEFIPFVSREYNRETREYEDVTLYKAKVMMNPKYEYGGRREFSYINYPDRCVLLTKTPE